MWYAFFSSSPHSITDISSPVVETRQISIKGGVDNFTVGPLTVRGTTGPCAIIECEVGRAVQHLFIDGVVSLFDAESTVHVEVDVLPEPKFTFYTYVCSIISQKILTSSLGRSNLRICYSSSSMRASLEA